jgi:uncharacterized protein (DUF2342 family)
MRAPLWLTAIWLLLGVGLCVAVMGVWQAVVFFALYAVALPFLRRHAASRVEAAFPQRLPDEATLTRVMRERRERRLQRHPN